MSGLSAALFGQLTAPAMVVALSPVSIVAVLVLLLHNDRPRPASLAFLFGRVVALAAATAVFLQVPRLADRFAEPNPVAAAWLLGIFGAVCVALGAVLWLRRDRVGAQPRWEARIARLGWVGAAAIGAVFVVANPKMMAANGAAGVMIGATVVSGVAAAVAIVFYTVLASCTVTAPVLAYVLFGARIDPALARIKLWIQRRRNLVTSVVLLVVGLALLVAALRGF